MLSSFYPSLPEDNHSTNSDITGSFCLLGFQVVKGSDLLLTYSSSVRVNVHPQWLPIWNKNTFQFLKHIEFESRLDLTPLLTCKVVLEPTSPPMAQFTCNFRRFHGI
jgi:hypothetical protein